MRQWVRCRRNSAKRRARRTKAGRRGMSERSSVTRSPIVCGGCRPENRFGVASIEPVAGSEVGAGERCRAPALTVGAPPVAVELEVRFDDGRVRRLPSPFSRVGQRLLRRQGPRSIGAAAFSSATTSSSSPSRPWWSSRSTGHSLVRGVMCLLRHEKGRTSSFLNRRHRPYCHPAFTDENHRRPRRRG